MSQDRHQLPPLEWIRVFEAAARLGSFTAAANELGLTQAAVSQRIRNLELHLGAQLFTRQARGVILSTQGESWLPHVQDALVQFQNSAANLFEQPRRKITIAASGSVIELWIIPRLGEIARRLPHVQLSLETIQHMADYQRLEADFEVRFGTGNWPDREARQLFNEELAPMASPALLGEREALAPLTRLVEPMMLLTSTATALAACGLLRTRSRIRSRKSAPATPISVSAEDPGARQPSVRRPRAAPS